MFRKRGAPVFLELMTPKGDGPGPRAPKPPAKDPGKTPPTPPAPLFEQAAAKVGPTVVALGQPEKVSHTVAGAPPAPAVEPKPKSAIVEELRPPSAAELEQHGNELLWLPWRRWLILAAPVMVLALGAYVVGYMVRGKEAAKREKNLIERLEIPDPLNKASSEPATTNTAKPPSPSGTGAVETKASPTPGPITRKTDPKPVGGPPAAVDTLKTGCNYLVVATLMKKDADEAAQFLVANKVPTVLVTAGGKAFDPSAADANNVQWQVVVLKGYAPTDFKALEPERRNLVNQVQLLGRKWKAENKKAPTDFSQVFWWKFKG